MYRYVTFLDGLISMEYILKDLGELSAFWDDLVRTPMLYTTQFFLCSMEQILLCSTE